MIHCHLSVFIENKERKNDGNVKHNGTDESVSQAKFRHKFSSSVNFLLHGTLHTFVCASYKFTCLHWYFAIEDTALELHHGSFSSNRTFSVFRARLHVNLWVKMNCAFIHTH